MLKTTLILVKQWSFVRGWVLRGMNEEIGKSVVDGMAVITMFQQWFVHQQFQKSPHLKKCRKAKNNLIQV